MSVVRVQIRKRNPNIETKEQKVGQERIDEA